MSTESVEALITTNDAVRAVSFVIYGAIISSSSAVSRADAFIRRRV